MKKIKNLIFDLGGVIINIDPELTIKAFKEAGISDIEKVYLSLKASGTLVKIETGEILFDDLYNEFLQNSNYHIQKGIFINCWNKLLLDVPKERIDMLWSLKQKYRTFLLSNTNPLHMKAIYGYLDINFGVELSQLFEKVYLSFEHAICKPDTMIFKKILNENHLVPEETVFFDDTEIHLCSANSLGIQVELVSSENPINNIVRNLDL